MPSIFTNDTSRGPLYQYWKERGQEEKALREQRIQEARLRSKGFRPMDPAFGPSSTESYAHRAASGPPAYGHESVDAEGRSEGSSSSSAAAVRQQQQQQGGSAGAVVDDNELPSYGALTGRRSEDLTGAGGEDPLLPAEEEKARLRRLEDQRRQIQADSALAQSLSTEDEEVATKTPAQAPEIKGMPPDDRRKSTAGKIGRWLAEAATGYTNKQERW
ncbi:uncharacterized protein Z520_11186 [Fonsecaea multimorphosa CBS 102226]|uniref:Uncharacterized protein n=1 Tax=Fonsecaea multimorphosa CBS 102226 TaxID=1442371 RepID=A0A0D2JRQ4_9EURO|nr:uncharacterized protein Z520_11186 [Fonsecaea multimorphosa CBS 102226]KIX93129.1 hypothetical protein Z520_11186 [Fonsecaea multimorphosa CBS 102226]OAL18331.1 hypothetical protein AYO22_10747 [Fonsecaea multimorphosa]